MAAARFLAQLLLLALTACVTASHFKLPVSRHSRPALNKREIDQGIWRPFESYQYMVNVSVGSPPQEMSMALSLTSAYSFVLDSRECEENKEEDDDDDDDDDYFGYDDYASGFYFECKLGAFDALSSDSVASTRDEFSASYGYNYASGHDIRDTIHIGGEGDDDGVKVRNMTLGLADDTSIEHGYLALGLNTSESTSYSYSYGSDYVEPTFLDKMADQEVINSPAFSFWYEDVNADNTSIAGSLLFGAVDKSKFSGEIMRIQADKYPAMDEAYAVTLSAATGSKSESGDPITLGTRSGDSDYIAINPLAYISNLPWEYALGAWQMAGAEYDSYDEIARVDCNGTDNIEGYVILEVGGEGGFEIRAELKDLIVPRDIYEDVRYVDLDSDDTVSTCMFGIQAMNYTSSYYSSYYSGDNFYTIGGNILKNYYTVFDASNREVGFAELSSDAADAESDIVPFEGLGAAIPESSLGGECSYPRNCYDDDDNSGNGSYGGGYGPGRSKMHRENMIIAVATSLGIFALITLILSIWAIRRCRWVRSKEKAAAAAAAEKGESEGEGEGEGDQTMMAGGAGGDEEGRAPALPPRARKSWPLPSVAEGSEPLDTAAITGAGAAAGAGAGAGAGAATGAGASGDPDATDRGVAPDAPTHAPPAVPTDATSVTNAEASTAPVGETAGAGTSEAAAPVSPVPQHAEPAPAVSSSADASEPSGAVAEEARESHAK